MIKVYIDDCKVIYNDETGCAITITKILPTDKSVSHLEFRY